MLKSFYTIVLLSMLLPACRKKEEPFVPIMPVENTNETITTVVVTFTDIQNFTDFEFRYTDLDGSGGNTPVISVPELISGTNYTVYVQLYNESISPVQNVTTQIENELEQHQLFYSVQAANLTLAYADEDADMRPVGMLMNAVTGDMNSGTLKITLRHEPNKGANGVAGGDITNAGGDTDIEVIFPVVIV